MNRARVLLAVCLLPALVAAGCGGDDSGTASDSRTGTTPITKAEYITHSDALCTEANKLTRGLNLNITSALRQGDYQGAAAAIDAELARIKPLYDELVNLPKPPGEEARLDTLNDARSRVLALIEQLAAAIRAQDDARVRGMTQELAAAGQRSRVISAGYGFQACGQG